MGFGIHPLVLLAAIGASLGLIALVVVCLARRGAVKAVMGVMAVIFFLPSAYLFVALHPELVDSRFRTYKKFYREINVGMTRDEVFALLDRFYPKTGKRLPPKILNDDANGLGFFMNPEKSTEPNCEGIFLELTGGRVSNKKYSRD